MAGYYYSIHFKERGLVNQMNPKGLVSKSFLVDNHLSCSRPRFPCLEMHYLMIRTE